VLRQIKAITATESFQSVNDFVMAIFPPLLMAIPKVILDDVGRPPYSASFQPKGRFLATEKKRKPGVNSLTEEKRISRRIVPGQTPPLSSS
jgi:hypothetical protein